MILYRCCWLAFLAQLVAGFFVEYSMVWGWLLIAVGLLLPLSLAPPAGAKTPAGGRSSGEGGEQPPAAREVEPPVTGRWSALNSPADKVPSHGTHAYGQTWAIDVVAEPEDGSRPAFGWWPPARRSSAFPAFGAQVAAVADATVVHAVGHRRDHLSRNSYPALLHLFLEGFFRDLSGSGRVTGNTVILRLDDGSYALYAHLRRGSLTVREGERVAAGQQIALCGNSGNSSEPHLHFQLMDDSDPDVARGLPFTWRGLGIPAYNEPFSVDRPTVS